MNCVQIPKKNDLSHFLVVIVRNDGMGIVNK